MLLHEIRAAAEVIASARDASGWRIMRADAEWRMLRVVKRACGVLSISDVGRRLRISRQAARNIVIRAARRGLVELEPNFHDRRLIQVELTRCGQVELAAEEARQKLWAMTLLNGLDRHQMRDTSHILRVIRQRIARDERAYAREARERRADQF